MERKFGERLGVSLGLGETGIFLLDIFTKLPGEDSQDTVNYFREGKLQVVIRIINGGFRV